MSSDDLKDATSLNVPGIHFVRVERASENDVFGLVNFEASELALHVGFKLSEPFVLQDIVGVNTAVKTAGEESAFVGEFDIGDLGFMLLESSQTKPTHFVPHFYFAIIGACR